MRFIVSNRIFHQPLFHFILIAAVGLLVYLNTFHSSFHFDDAKLIVDNPLIKDFRYFTDSSMREGLELDDDIVRFFRTRSVGYFTFWVSYRLGGLEVEGWHAMNLAIHIINALLIYVIVSLTFRTPLLEVSRTKEHSQIVALLSGILFVSHPIQTEAVTYVVQRVVVLAAMFYLASTASYIGSRLSNGKRKYILYALSLVLAYFGMKTKENVFTLPVVIVLYEFMFFRGGIRKKVMMLVPVLLMMAIIPFEYISMNRQPDIGTTIEASSRYPFAPGRLEYLNTQFIVVVKYMRMLLLPVGQSVDHDQPVMNSFLNPQVFLSFLFIVSVMGTAVYLYRLSHTSNSSLRVISFGIFWFFISLSVESSLLPIGEMMVEYRVYLPAAGMLVAIGGGAVLMIAGIDGITVRKALSAMLVALLIVFSSASYARNGIWKNDRTLWQDALRKSPGKARVHNNLGNAYRDEGMIDSAIDQYRIALSLDPYLTIAHDNLGNAYAFKGMLDKAIEHFRFAVDQDPNYANAHNNLGNAYMAKGLLDKAVKHFQVAIRLKPDYVLAYNNLGAAYWSLGVPEKAIENLRIAVDLDPGNTDAHFNLGVVLFNNNNMEEARREFITVLQIRPDDVEASRYLERIAN